MPAAEHSEEGPGRRCGIGCATWPDAPDYKTCPLCGEPTRRYSKVSPLSEDEARSAKLHAEFEAFYEAREADLDAPVD